MLPDAAGPIAMQVREVDSGDPPQRSCLTLMYLANHRYLSVVAARCKSTPHLRTPEALFRFRPVWRVFVHSVDQFVQVTGGKTGEPPFPQKGQGRIPPQNHFQDSGKPA